MPRTAANTTEDSTADCKRNKTAKRQAETVSQQQYLQELPMPAKRAKTDGCIVDENLNTNAEAMEDRALQEKGIMEHRVPQKVKHPVDGKDKMKSSRFQNLQAQAHLCPVTKEIFRKYTNIDQIAESYCKKMYSDVKRYCCTQISRFYLIYYLMPNLRTSRPLSKLKILPNCPDDIKEKILEIPKHLQQENHANNNIPSSVNKDVSHTNITSESHVDRAEDVNTATKENENNAQTTSSQAIAIESVNTLSAASTSRHETKILKNVQGLSSSKEDNIQHLHQDSREVHENKQELSNSITILEDRLLPKLSNTQMQKYVEASPTSPKKDCRCCNLPYSMFINKTNILDIVRETTDTNNETVIYRMYLQFLKEDESIFIPSLNISASLVKILMKHKKFCDKCKQILESLTPRAPTVNNNEKEENLHMNKTNYSISTFPNNITEGFSETPCRKELEQMQIDEHCSTYQQNISNKKSDICDQNNVPNNMTEIVAITESQAQPFDERPAPISSIVNKNNLESITAQQGLESSVKGDSTMEVTSGHTSEKLGKRWYAKFKSLLLQKLCQKLRIYEKTTMPVSLEQFKKLSHWHMPLREILNDFCGQNRNLLETLEKDKTVYNTLLLYYYKSYFTNSSLREKYGLQIKLCPASLRNKMLTIVETNNAKKDTVCEELSTPISTACPETSDAYPDNLEKVKPCSNKESLVFKSPQKTLAGNVSKNKGNIQKSPQRQQSIETITNTKSMESMPVTIVKAPQNCLGENVSKNTSNIQKSPEQQQSIEAINNIKSVESMSVSIEQAQLCSDNSSEIKDSSSIIKFPQKSHDENVSDNIRNMQKSPQRQQSIETMDTVAPMPINQENAQHSSDKSIGIGESSATHKSPDKVLGEHVIENNGDVRMPTHQQQSIENIKTIKSMESRPNQAEPERGNQDKCVVRSVDIPCGTKKSSDSLKSPKRKQRKISGTTDKSSLSDMGNLPNVENSTSMSTELKRTRKLPEQFLELLKKPKSSNTACSSTETSKASIKKPKSNTACSSTETSKASNTKSKLKEPAPVFIKLQRPQKRQTRSLSMQQSSNESASKSETNPISRSLVEVEYPRPKESSSEKQISCGSPPPSIQDLEVDKQLEATSDNKLVLNKTSERLDSSKHKTFSENLETAKKSAQIMAGHTEILKENASPTTSKPSGNDELRQRLDQAMKIYFQRYNKTYTLPYMLRTCGGIKRRIIETILNLDVDTFRSITNIYQASELNTNTDIYRELYKYTLKGERVWPKNLFIKLQDFCKFLKMQSISVPEAANALMYISPRFLHWSDLRENTNIMENVKLYRLKHTYKHLNVADMQEVEKACRDYYDQCWTVDDWILDVPLIAKDLMNMVFVTEDHTATNGDVLKEIHVELCDNESSRNLQPQTTVEKSPWQIKCELMLARRTVPFPEKQTNASDTPNPPQEDVISLRLSSSSEDSIPLVVIHNRIEGKLSNNFNKPPDTATTRDVVVMNALGEAGLSTSITDVTHFSEYPIDLETQMSAYITDPLNATIDLDNNDINLEANKIRSEDKNIDEVDISSDSSVVFVPVAIKEETKPLKNLLFVLEDDDTIQCSHLSEEVLSLDTSENEHIEDIDLPPSQIDFDDTNAPVISAPITTGNSQNSSCSNSKETQSQSMATDAVQFIHLLGKKQTTNETSKPSEREKAPQPLEHLSGQQLESEMEPSFCAIPNAQRFPSTFEESVTTEIAGIQIPKASLAKKKHPQPPSMAAVNKKKIAKASPSKTLKSSDVVPQLAHPLRALPVVTVNVLKQIESSADAEQQNQIQPNVFLEVDEEILPDDFVPGHTSTQDKHQSKNDAVQLQIQPSPPSLQVSQELSTDKTIFNNSSLLRAIDHNYNKAVENANKAKTPDSRTNSTDTAESREKPSKVTTAIASPVCNILLPSVTRKIILYRNFLEFHYFQFLTPEQVSKYELATTNYYSQYLEATIHSGTLKTKLLSDSFFELFPQWSPALRADFLIVLNDLKEFHFSRFSRPLKNCDLRNNIIYELLSSASPFCKAQLIYDEHNSEFCSLKSGWKTCYSNSHMRKPFQPLTNAIQPNILNALSTLKKALRNQSAESTEFVRK